MTQQKKSLLVRFFNRIYSSPQLLKLWGSLQARRMSAAGRTGNPIPFTPLQKPLSSCRVALVTTGGLHLPEQPPFNMENPHGDASYRAIPGDVDLKHLVITHKYYDSRDAERDKNILFPLDHLRDLQKRGVIGSLADRHFSFMGHIVEEQTRLLLKRTAPEVAHALRADQVDLVLMTPA